MMVNMQERESSITGLLKMGHAIVHSLGKQTSMDYDEIYQEVCVAFCEAVDRYDPSRETKLSTYAWTVGRNAAINALKKATRQNAHSSIDAPAYAEGSESVADTIVGCEDITKDVEVMSLADSHFSELSPIQKKIAYMLLEGAKQKEIAFNLGCSQSNVAQHIERIRKNMVSLKKAT